jgi:hypothetical protein
MNKLKGYRAIDIKVINKLDRKLTMLDYIKIIWGQDVWIDGIPVIKLLILFNILANITIWVILFRSIK